jgi:hypothetical protein
MKKPKKCNGNNKAPVADPAVEPEQKPEAVVQEQAEPQGEAALNAAEEMKLEQFETVLKPGLGSFMVVGKALKAIRDERLYRAKFKTFEDYCRQRWDLSDKYAYRHIDAYTVVENLVSKLKTSPNGETRLPTNESQVRPLTSLEPEQQIKAWQQVLKLCAGKPITANEVQAVVDKMGGNPPKEETAKPKTALKKAETKLEKIDKLVAEALEADETKLTVAKLKEVLEKIQKLLGNQK